jgi:2-dehydropantoate 2-reductase
MKIAVLGCGAIGGLFLGYLRREGVNVVGVVKEYQKEPFLQEGLFIKGVRGEATIKDLNVDVKLKERVDVAVVSVKIPSIREIMEVNKSFLEEATVVTTQNGIGGEEIVGESIPYEKIISGIVMFGATFYSPNKVVHNFEGELVIGNVFDKEVEGLEEIKAVLSKVFNTTICKNIKGAKYLKVLVNLNNCIPACLGVSMQEAFSNLEIARVAISLLKEAYQVIKESNIVLESLPSYPKERIERLVNMPLEEAAKVFSQIMCNLSNQPLYGSILQSIKKKRKSEVDYINGAIVRLAHNNGLRAPLNRAMVDMVQSIEKGSKFYGPSDFVGHLKISRAKPG